MSLEALRQRAGELGVETSYWDVEGQLHHASEATLAAVVDVLEADAPTAPAADGLEPVFVGTPGGRVPVGALTGAELHLVDGTAVALAVHDGAVVLPGDVPIGCHRLIGEVDGRERESTVVVPPATMPRAERFERAAGLFVPAYALWERDAPLPSFGHLGALATTLGQLGLEVLSTLPLYAPFLDEPFDPSPYAPASRLHWNEVYLDDDSLPPARLETPGELVDWRSLAARRRHQLLTAVGGLDPATNAAVDAFAAARPDVADFARFATERRSPNDAGYPAATIERSYLLAQYLAHAQLAAVEAEDGAALALDLPIGSHGDGYETWAYRDLFAPGMSVGAPPDALFEGGQDWGFPPVLPGASRRSGHALWRQLVARAGEYASMLRIDHVMGVQRLWWVPWGAGATDGVYVRYPRDELLAVIAAEAYRSRTTIVGEDLGTVSDEVRAALTQWDVVGMYEEQFHLHSPELPRPPRRAVAGIRTHDMPAFAATVEQDGGPEGLADYRHRLEHELGRAVDASTPGLLDAVLDRLARSDADVVLVDLDDLLGQTAPHNVPGMVLETTWRRRLPAPASEVLARPEVRERLERLAARGGARPATVDPEQASRGDDR